MTKFIVSVLGMSALATSAFAAGGIADIDTNGDGLLTVDEVQVAYPDMSTDQFSQIDTNGDGAVDDAELGAAKESGMLPADSSSEG